MNKNETIEFKTIEDLIKYVIENADNTKTNDTQKVEKPNYKPEIGDIVEVVEGDFNGVKGEIIAEVEAYYCYQIKISNINAIYIPKDKVKVVKKKADEERLKKIKELENEIIYHEDSINSLKGKLLMLRRNINNDK